MCTRDTTCEYFGHCECGGCPCNDITCYPENYDGLDDVDGFLPHYDAGVDDLFAMASVERWALNSSINRFNGRPWRFRIQLPTGQRPYRKNNESISNRRRMVFLMPPNYGRRKHRNFVQKFYVYARDGGTFRQRYSLVRKFQ